MGCQIRCSRRSYRTNRLLQGIRSEKTAWNVDQGASDRDEVGGSGGGKDGDGDGKFDADEKV